MLVIWEKAVYDENLVNIHDVVENQTDDVSKVYCQNGTERDERKTVSELSSFWTALQRRYGRHSAPYTMYTLETMGNRWIND